ncbi:Acg family FMN-binding oxidoreductase [Streptomyces boncukensis]|uniref:Nitroreductase domain-containing protein n=1 Tax=Streptomyces boncukensis TaxID=2711219 RepID=A0A6G4X5H1_9ACTN|nr:nitroreductase family protein [Streptomyces boncukensis]NGO71984.1 hypothetical protein [Streptomyces boncukensis]
MTVPDLSLLTAEDLEVLLAAATAAPSIHNTQPWRFHADPVTRSIEVHRAPQRALPLTDPACRAQYLSVGAAVFNLRLAADRLGRRPVVRLLPRPDQPALLAGVRLIERPYPRERWGPALYQAIARRHSSRMPFTGRPVPGPVVAELTRAARVEGAWLRVPAFAGIQRVLRLTAAGESRNVADSGRAAESRTWVTPPGAGAYGIPVTALGPRDLAGRIPLRDFAAARRTRRAPALRFERHTQLAVLCTAHDRRVDWLRAGQALQHALLVATAHGVRTSMLHQAMEWPDLRHALRGTQQRRCCPQLLIRFGYGPEGGWTPRAPAELSTGGPLGRPGGTDGPPRGEAGSPSLAAEPGPPVIARVTEPPDHRIP